MSEKIKVLGISGSLRKNSYNTSLLRASIELMPENMTMDIFPLNYIPLYNEDTDREGLPEPVKLFKYKIAESDSLLIACPEYNYSFTGVLKNAIDWASRPPATSPLQKKPYGLIGATSGIGGTIKAQMHFRQVAVFNNMFGMNQPQVYVTLAKQKFNEKIVLTDEPTREHLAGFLKLFYDWTIHMRSLSNIK